MTNPDKAEDKAAEAAAAIQTKVGELWLTAHANGVRNGIELAAQYLDGAATGLHDHLPADEPVPARVAVETLRTLRDDLRLAALQTTSPEPPNA